MIRVDIIDEKIFQVSYSAFLVGWVNTDKGLHALVVEGDGDTPWLVPLARINVRL